MAVRIHPTALVEDGVDIGEGTSIWDSVHVRGPAKIGKDCIVGEKTYIAYDVVIGDRCKLNAMVYIPTAVTIEDGVMISAGTIFTNDLYPRSCTSDLSALRTSDADEHTLPTLVKEGCTIGAAATIGPGIELGRFSMVGMGSVVTATIPDFHLRVGNPARTIAAVARNGEPLVKAADGKLPDGTYSDSEGYRYQIENDLVTELGKS